MDEGVFAEHSLRVRVVAGADPEPVTVRRHAGVSVRPAGSAAHRWRPLPSEPAGAAPAAVPGAGRRAVEALTATLDDPPAGDVVAAARRVVGRVHAAAGALGLDRVKVAVRWGSQTVATQAGGDARTERRVHFTLGVSAREPSSGARVDRDAGSNTAASLDEAATAVEAALADVVPRLRAGPVPAPAGGAVVLAGGETGVFFHELVGHPLEADVVLAGGSYLAAGDPCGSPLLTVVDDPRAPGALVPMSIDDEGGDTEPVTLVAQGRVRGLLADRATAAAAGIRPNGHGRRLDYTHAPVPRQTHLRVAVPEAPSDPVAGTRRGVLVTALRPRHVDIAGGGFSFVVLEARQVADGRLGPQVRPFALEGFAREALGAIDAIGAVPLHSGGRGGCSKLDQGPLPGSFSQPPVRVAEPGLRWHG